MGPLPKASDDLALSTIADRSVAGERGQYPLVPKILAPRLKILRRSALSLASATSVFRTLCGLKYRNPQR